MKFPWVGEVRRLSCLCVVGFEGPNDSEEMGLVVVGCLQVVGVVVVGLETVAKMVVMVVVVVEVDDVGVGQVAGPVVIGGGCCLDVEGVGGLGVQVVWCSRSGSCGCPVDAASSWKVLAHMGWCGQAAQWPSAIVHKLPCPLHPESAVLSDSLSQQEPSVLPVLLRLVLNLPWSTVGVDGKVVGEGWKTCTRS